MLGKMLAAVPNIVAAALILVVTYYIAKFAAGLLARLLASIGFDTLPEKLGFASAFAGGTPPSRLVSILVLFFAMLFATVEAANRTPRFARLSRCSSNSAVTCFSAP